MTEVYLVAAARTGIGAFGGSLKDQKPGELGGHVATAALTRAKVDPSLVGNVFFGHVIPTAPRDVYVARIAAMAAGVPKEAPALTLNRLCGSGLQAIISGAQSILLGDSEIVLAGGTEVMSQAAYFAPAVRWGQKMGEAAMLDGLTGALTDPFNLYHMGVTAENIAEQYGISREDQDALALESQQRAARAVEAGYFRDQIAPVELKSRKGVVSFATDEFVRTDASLDELSKLRPVFRKENGTVTPGNASGINDGAAAVVLASEAAVRKHQLTPMARLVAYGHAGIDPSIMGIGPVPATRQALERSGLKVADLDVIEANEAFAAQACAVARQLEFDPARVNPNGSGISLGHPVGATGAIIATKLVHELQRTQGRYGLTTMCIGGGQGIAAIWERA
ncbi:acetyl-CoA C-acetyltransferase [Sphingobium faniae]|nr:acetyl-CoA C-acetyltransferase [Sphingobium faniae]